MDNSIYTVFAQWHRRDAFLIAQWDGERGWAIKTFVKTKTKKIK